MNTSISLQPETAAETTSLVTQMTAIQKVTSDSMVEVANTLCLDAKKIAKSITEFFDPHVKRAHEVHKGLTLDRAKYCDPLTNEAKRVQRLIDDYRTEQLRAAQAAARKQAEELRIKQEAEALAHAQKLEERGRADIAARVIEEQIAAPAPKVEIVKEDYAPTVVGLGTKLEWFYEVEYIALVPKEFVVVNDQLIKATIKFRQDIPGLKITQRVKSIQRG
jgi:hypothetical protein